LLAGVHEVLQQRGLQLLLLDSDAPDIRGKVDGALVNTAWNIIPSNWHDEKGPCVGLLLPSRTAEISSVVSDDYAGQRQATQHLLDLGHRRIAYLHSKAAKLLVPNRRAGYFDALQAAGVEPENRWVRPLISEVQVMDFRATGRESMAAWLREDWSTLGCTALVCHNDETAVGAMEALQEAGWRVPEDVSVVGFDGTELCEYARPRLTSVEISLHELGRAATELLLHHIEHGVDEWKHLTLPITLRVRASTAPPRTI
jgi:DNA-binding LacI/PurR family transcriptional regulator